MLRQAEDGSAGSLRVTFTLPALTAFWGRLLSSTHSPRSRRRLSEAECTFRGVLAGKLEAALGALREASPSLVDLEVQTRRPAEQEWMRQRLQSDPESPPLLE